MKDIVTKARLLDCYGPLLTERQRLCMEAHFEEDWSLAEIAEELSISRQAVHDAVQRASQLLEEYEMRLGCVAQREERMKTLQRLQHHLRATGALDAVAEELLQELGVQEGASHGL